MKRLITIVYWLSALVVCGQSDMDILSEAQRLSAETKYDQALQVIEGGLDSYPNHHDLMAYKVRVLLWDRQYALAEEAMEQLQSEYPNDVEAWELRLTGSLWQEKWERLLTEVELAKAAINEDQSLEKYRLKALLGLKRYKDAKMLIEKMNDPSLDKLREILFLNDHHFASVSGEHSQFSEVFTPWTLLTATYGHTSRHSWNASTTYGHMFDQNGVKFNLNAYPTISRSSSVHLELGYSPSDIFADFEAGGEWIQSVKRWDFTAGTKYFDFDDENILVYKSSIGYYPTDSYVNYRVYYSEVLETPSWTHLLTLRRFFSNRFHYLQLQGSLGSTPIQISNLIEAQRLDARAVSLSYKHLFVKHRWMMDAGIGLQNETYLEGQSRDRFNFQLGVSRLWD